MYTEVGGPGHTPRLVRMDELEDIGLEFGPGDSTCLREPGRGTPVVETGGEIDDGRGDGNRQLDE